MRRLLKAWFACAKNAMLAGKGRPMAFAVLLGLSLLNLGSEWPQGIARPALLDTFNDVLPNSFGTARQLL
ncbi:MAG TPA: sensor protein Chase2, partial [Paraburkholderia sp.]|nr:sensor protein Chase2 [Paraburkholderia sp.]